MRLGDVFEMLQVSQLCKRQSDQPADFSSSFDRKVTRAASEFPAGSPRKNVTKEAKRSLEIWDEA